jgi:hypothetical protein
VVVQRKFVGKLYFKEIKIEECIFMKTLCLQCLSKSNQDLWVKADDDYLNGEDWMRCPVCEDIQSMEDFEEHSGY